MKAIRRSIPLLIATSLAAGCGERAPTTSRFTTTGELIALSGGEGGAANACIACHGLHGEGDGKLSPRIAGLDAGYIVRQLGFFADGQRDNPQMAFVAGKLSVDDRQKVAAYYARLRAPSVAACPPPITAHPLYARGDPDRGLEPCASCHGSSGSGNAGNPPLAGQPAPYLRRQLEHWQEGRRYGDPLGAMTRISKALTAAQLAALTADTAAPPDESANPESPATCPPGRRAGPRNDASARR